MPTEREPADDLNDPDDSSHSSDSRDSNGSASILTVAPVASPTPVNPERTAAGAASGPLFPTGNVLRVIGVSRRQLQYWAETGLVAPSARTPGGHRRYTFADLVALKAAKQLIDAGISVQRIRSSIGALRRILPEVRHPLSELVLVATGDVVLVLREGTAFEALSGQEWIVEVARFQREIEHVLGSDEVVASKPALGKNPGPRTAVKVAARRREDARIA